MLVWRIWYWSISNPIIDIFLYSHHLSAWYCIDVARRNSVLVTHGSYRVKLIYKICCNSLAKTAQVFFYKIHIIQQDTPELHQIYGSVNSPAVFLWDTWCAVGDMIYSDLIQEKNFKLPDYQTLITKKCKTKERTIWFDSFHLSKLKYYGNHSQS